MENLGQRITDYRKKSNLTQKDLGEKLNVSPQAVSKWENGQAEPDASTIKKLCEIFKISTDELLGNTPPFGEVAATVEVAPVQAPAPVQVPTPQIIRETVVEQKIINGYCERCKKPVGPGEYVVERYGRSASAQSIYCNECKAKMTKAHNVAEYEKHKKYNLISVIAGAIAGVAVFLIVLLAMMFAGETPAWFATPFAVVFGLAGFSFTMQMFWDGMVREIFFFFLKSFKMPGVIFTLDLDGLIFLLLVKVGGAILGAFLSVLFFLIGMIITPLGSLLILPFAAIKRASETKNLKAAAEK